MTECHRDFVLSVTAIMPGAFGAHMEHRPLALYSRSIVRVYPACDDRFSLTDDPLSGVMMVTVMPRCPTPPDLKTGALRRAGALHPHPERIHDQAFLDDPFFDPRDRVQVKYEMVRRHRVEGRPVTEVAAAFSVSRQAFYEAAAVFETGGLPGLLPKRPGPKRAHKCSEEILDFAEQWSARGEDPDVTTAIARRFHRTIHPRSLERALARRKKKRAESEQAR